MFTMINNVMFTKRLQEILTHYELSASAFAEKMGVGRSSISHIISGRNKPSLEFVLHILENFKEVTFDWLMLGKGKFPNSTLSSEPDLFNSSKNTLEKKAVDQTKEISFSNTTIANDEKQMKNEALSIERVIIFYSDNSFKEYKN